MTQVVSGHPVRRLPLAELRERAVVCRSCPLEATRHNVVFGDGDPKARLLIVGEAPGADEDASGLPFQGRAGTMLDGLLARADLFRGQVYVTNVVMCRPPGNRRPTKREIDTCSPYLESQLDIVRPLIILALGATATKRFLGWRSTIKSTRGIAHQTEFGTVVATYHPSPVSLNRDPARRLAVEADLALVHDLLAHP